MTMINWHYWLPSPEAVSLGLSLAALVFWLLAMYAWLRKGDTGLATMFFFMALTAVAGAVLV